MRLSAKGAEFLGGFEGFRAEPYNDPAGHATLGFGHLLHLGKVSRKDIEAYKEPLTRKQGLELLRKDATRFEKCVSEHVKVNLTQAQFDALVSFVFNVGQGAFRASTLLRSLNSDRRNEAANQLLRWDKAGAPPRALPGLTRRRRAERKLLLTGLYHDGNAPAQKPKITLTKGPSKSFTWQEVHRGRSGFTPAARARATLHARKLEKLRGRVNALRKRHGLKPTGINVLSWFRPRWYNAKIGGASRSRHMKGDATDISLQEIRRLMPWKGGRNEFDSIAGEVFKTGGFGTYPAGSRHVDSRGTRARWSSF